MNYVTTLKVGNPTRKYLLTRLADRADERYSCNPSVGLLAAELEIQPRAVQKQLQALREAGLISDRVAQRADGLQTTNRFYIHGPWDDFGGTGVPFPTITTPRQARAELWAQAAAEGEFRPGTAAAVAASAGQEGVSYRTSPPVSCGTSPGVSPGAPLEPSVVTTTTEAAPSGRVAPPDARRASTGSRRTGVGGGSAASGKTTTPKLTPKQQLAVDAVWELLPAELRTVPRNARGLRQAIVNALAFDQPAERTAEQLVRQRVEPRWHRYWAAEFDAGRVESLVGALRSMLERDPLCGDARCDEHVNVDSGQPCRACERHRGDRKAERGPRPGPAAVPAQKRPVRGSVVHPMRNCPGCDRGFRAPEPGLCGRCRLEVSALERAAAWLAAPVGDMA